MVREVIDVNYGGNKVGAVSFNTETGLGEFEYYPEFIALNVELSPIKMPLDRKIYSFPELEFETFRGLPGLVADSLPDDFGNAVLNSWVASQGKDPESITPLQRLQYIGKRDVYKRQSMNSTMMIHMMCTATSTRQQCRTSGNVPVNHFL